MRRESSSAPSPYVRAESNLPPPPRPTLRKSMPIPKAAPVPGTRSFPGRFPGHDLVDEPLTARLDNSPSNARDSIYGELTATSRRPAETYEKWLAENPEAAMDDVATESVEAAVPRRGEPMTERMPERDPQRIPQRVERVAPRRTDVSVDVSIEEIEDADGLFADGSDGHSDRHSDPVVESHVSDADDHADDDLDEPYQDTRNGAPRAYGSQPVPAMNFSGMSAAPRISTALGLGPSGFAPVPSQGMQPMSGSGAIAHPMAGPMPQPMSGSMPIAMSGSMSGSLPLQQSVHAMLVPSGSQSIPLQSAQLQALRMQAMQQIQSAQMQAAQNHRQSGQMQSAPNQMPGQMQPGQMQPGQMQPGQMQQQMPPQMIQQMQYQMQGAPPVITPGLSQVRPAIKAESKVVHRAPWFCLGLMVGVAAMVAAFFMPSTHESASSDMKVQSIAPQAQMQAQMPMVPPPMQQAAPAPFPQQPQMTQPGQQATQPTQQPQQMGAPRPGQQGAPPQAAAATKPVPTVDVRTLPIAGQKTSTAAPRRAARPAARRAPAPKPLTDDDDAPAAAPKPTTPAPSDTVNGDVFLQAL